ncbi:hypothetical protein EI94DRAFT_1697267 [Lactarius quietus]|nr:hypothetical protein EI94DRAFT_1697267 [Lactarius quietus]
MLGTPWEGQPCRELRENHASFDSLNEKADDARTENVGATFSGGARGRVSHDGQMTTKLYETTSSELFVQQREKKWYKGNGLLSDLECDGRTQAAVAQGTATIGTGSSDPGKVDSNRVKDHFAVLMTLEAVPHKPHKKTIRELRLTSVDQA